MTLNDLEIKRRCVGDTPMISPFLERLHSSFEADPEVGKVPSFGLTSAGYDIRLGRMHKVECAATMGDDFMIVNPPSCDTVILIEPGTLILGQSVERLQVPDDIMVRIFNKSTYARLGINIAITIAEPGWCGVLTLEISNHSKKPRKLFMGAGIAQLQFEQINRPMVTYADRDGKYQGQKGVTEAVM